MKTIVIATDSFKGSASSQEVAEDLQRGLPRLIPVLKLKKYRWLMGVKAP